MKQAVCLFSAVSVVWGSAIIFLPRNVIVLTSVDFLLYQLEILKITSVDKIFVMSRDQNAVRSHNIKTDNSSFEGQKSSNI
jgi:hypothetical protein